MVNAMATPNMFPDAILQMDDMTLDVQVILCAAPLAAVGFFSLLFVVYLRTDLLSKKTGKDIDKPRIDYLAAKVKSGSIAFLKEEYKYLGGYVVAWAIILIVLFFNKAHV
jgi:Na+/H+-translocating membrane pyrophosphatase